MPTYTTMAQGNTEREFSALHKLKRTKTFDNEKEEQCIEHVSSVGSHFEIKHGKNIMLHKNFLIYNTCTSFYIGFSNF